MEEYAGQSYSDLIDNSDNVADNLVGNSSDNVENGENLADSSGESIPDESIPAENIIIVNGDISGTDSIALAENPAT